MGRISTRRQFQLLAKPHRRAVAGPLRFTYTPDPNGCGEFVVAFAIGRKVGGAVVRNRIRRRLRHILKDVDPRPVSGLYLIRCGVETSEATYEQLRTFVVDALKKIHER